jgi:hypothetical protein
LEGQEYEAARKAANRIDKKTRDKDPAAHQDMEIHEIHPIKFGGDPIDKANKMLLSKEEHRRVTDWWEWHRRNLQRGKRK